MCACTHLCSAEMSTSLPSRKEELPSGEQSSEENPSPSTEVSRQTLSTSTVPPTRGATTTATATESVNQAIDDLMEQESQG